MKAKIDITVSFSVKCELTEGELRALDAMVCYGHKQFIDVFKEKLGKTYIGPYEKDMLSLFNKIETLRPKIDEINEARKSLGLSTVGL